MPFSCEIPAVFFGLQNVTQTSTGMRVSSFWVNYPFKDKSKPRFGPKSKPSLKSKGLTPNQVFILLRLTYFNTKVKWIKTKTFF